MRQFAPWVLVAIALAAIFPAVTIQRQQKAADAAEQDKAKAEVETSQEPEEGEYPQTSANPCRPKEGEEESPWCEPLRVLHDFYGLDLASASTNQESDQIPRQDLSGEASPAPEKKPTGKELAEQIAAKVVANASAYRIKLLVALVPDPVESQIPYLFDSALDAIQKGFAEEDYLFDRYWLPWMGEAGKKDHLYRTSPGILLFRQAKSRRLVVVLLVGESPKAGIHKKAFQQAMEIAAGLRAATTEARIDILGPSFSGSVDSLMMALEDWWRLRESVKDHMSFRIASGSATAMGIKERFQELEKDWKAKGFDCTLSFCRTVVPDHLLQSEAARFLSAEMKWDLDEAALLAESDTGYGQGLSAFSQRIVNVRFSSGISDLRNAWKSREQDQRSEENDIKLGNTLLTTSREALDLSLRDRDKALDTVPRFSSLSTLARDQELAVLLEAISRDSIRYVGVLATDLKDRLFVMETVQRFVPDTVVFTFDNDVLLGHVDYSAVMDGVLVISSSPLFTEGASWLPRSRRNEGEPRERRQFQSESHQGIFEAVRYLLDAKFKSTPQVWISVVGNGSLWPIAQLPLEGRRQKAVFCQADQPALPFTSPPKLSEKQGGLAGKTNLQIIFFAAALCLASFGLQRTGFLGDSGVVPLNTDQQVSHTLLTVGEAILALAAAVLLVVAAIPEWASIFSTAWAPLFPSEQTFLSNWTLRRALLLAALAIVYVYLCCRIARRASRDRFLPVTRILCGLVIVSVPFFLMCLIFDLWMPNGEIAFFQLRARAYSSGFSPIVSLTLLAAAVVVWLACELRRRWLLERQNASDCALHTFCSTEPSLQGCRGRLQRVQELLCQIFPRKTRRGEHPWLVPLRKTQEFLRRIFSRKERPGEHPWLVRLRKIQEFLRRILPRKEQRHPWFLSLCVLLPPVILLWDTLQPITETRSYGHLFLAFIAVTAYLAALSFYRFVHVWLNLHRVLLRLDHISPALAKTLETLAPELDWKPMRSFGFRIPPFKMLILSISKLKAVLEVEPLNGVDAVKMDELIRKVFQAEGESEWRDEVRFRKELDKAFTQACKELKDDPSSLPEVQEFLAVRIVAYLRYVFAHLRNCLMGSLGTGLLLLLAVSAYAFEPKQFVSFVIWMSLAIAAALTLWIFAQMDRNPTLSRIGGTKEGKVTFDRTFFTNIFLYGAVPLLGVIATQFPAVGRALGQIVDPLLRVMGGG